MEEKILELCKKVINGETPHYSCQEIDCLDCPFKDMKIDCYTNSIEIEEIAQNYIKEHEKTVNTIEKNDNDYKKGFNDGFEYAMRIMKNKLEEMKKII